MKKLLITCMILALTTVGFAQNKKEKTKVDFYGVDFSAVNVIGAQEESEKFIDVFAKINGLLITEQRKYDVAKYLGLEVLSTNYDPAVKQIEKLKDTPFRDLKQTDINLSNIVLNYPNNDKNNGLVIIAKELNKVNSIGTFIAVIYDGNSKNILSKQEFSGEARGFGLRNFWAGALYNGLKSAKKATNK